MTEKEAWKELEKHFSSKSIPFIADMAMCSMIRRWRGWENLPWDTAEEMFSKIRLEIVRTIPEVQFSEINYTYLYPLTPEGSRKRAEFCRRMVEEMG